MKNKLTLLLLLCFCMAAYSQDEDVLRPKGRPASDGSQTNNRQSKSKSGKNPWSYGVEVGLNLNMYSESLTGLQSNSRFAVFESGSGFSPFLGAYLDYALSDNTGIQFKLAVDQKDFSNTKDGIRDATDYDNNTTIDAFVKGEFKTSASYYTITPQFRWNFTQDFFLLVGPTLHIKAISATRDSTESITSPDNVYYAFGTPQQSKVIKSSDTDLNIITARVGLEFDLAYQYKVTPKMTFVPKIGYQYMFTNFVESQNFVDDSRNLTKTLVPVEAKDAMLHSLQLSIGIWYNF